MRRGKVRLSGEKIFIIEKPFRVPHNREDEGGLLKTGLGGWAYGGESNDITASEFGSAKGKNIPPPGGSTYVKLCKRKYAIRSVIPSRKGGPICTIQGKVEKPANWPGESAKVTGGGKSGAWAKVLVHWGKKKKTLQESCKGEF